MLIRPIAAGDEKQVCALTHLIAESEGTPQRAILSAQQVREIIIDQGWARGLVAVSTPDDEADNPPAGEADSSREQGPAARKDTPDPASAESHCADSEPGSDPAKPAPAAEEDLPILGAVIYFPAFESFAGKRAFFIENLAVSPQAQGRGIASALLAELKRIGQPLGVDRFVWHCHRDNRAARQFYEQRVCASLEEQYLIYLKPFK